MRRTIVLAGNSPLLYFVAHELNKSVARHVENNVVWLTSEKYVPDLAVNQRWSSSQSKIILAKKLSNIKVIATDIKSISTRERRIISSHGVINYDLLIIDQQPLYKYEELTAIKKAVTNLMLSVKALHNQAKPSAARIICKGDSAESLELACRISELIRTDFPKLVRSVGVDVPLVTTAKSASSFMKANNLFETGTRKAELTLTIETPQPYVALTTIKGIKVGLKGIALVESDMRVKGNNSVIILGNANRAWQNLLHFQQTVAKRLAKNIDSILESQPTQQIEMTGKAFLLSANDSAFVELGTMVSNRTRARIISSWERRLFQRLQD